jgi:hypothetical protein
MPNTGIPARDINYGVVQYLSVPITFADNGVAKQLGTLPAKAVVIQAGVLVTTAFNAGTTNVVDLGTGADDDGFATDLALGTVGLIAADELATSNDLYSTNEVPITATVSLAGTAATAGAGIAFVTYIVNR